MIGKTISHYEIMDRIGQGGMGAVYKAKDLLLHRTVAIKVLPPQHSGDRDRRERFLREARAASSLNHPNIITIHDVVQEDDCDYLVMELIEGSPLNRLIPDGGLSLDRALQIAVPMAQALSMAHAAGIVHRDLKPGNVMVTEDGVVKVLDFGLAKWVDREDDADETALQSLTKSGQIIGTVAYMSPEQVRGDAVDRRSDIFSFGVMLYEMLAGANPFRGSSVVTEIHAIAFDDPMPLADLRSELGPVAPVVERTLAKSAGDRFQNMDEVLAALEQLRQGEEPTLAMSGISATAAPTDLEGPRQRTPRWIYAVVAVIVLASLLLVPTVRQAIFFPTDTKIDAATNTIERPILVTVFDRYDYGNRLLNLYYRDGAIDEAIVVLRGAIEMDSEYAPAHAALAKAHWRKYRDDFDRAWLDQALPNAERAVELDDHLTVAKVTRGLVLMSQGELERARADFDAALQMDPTNADALRGLGDLALTAGDTDQAERQYNSAIESRDDDQELYGRLGVLYYREGRYDEAASMFERSTELSPDNFGAYRNLGAAQHMVGDYGKAAATLQHALEIRADPSVYTNLGTLYFFQGLYTQAKTALEKALELGPNQYLVWGNLGDVYRFLPGREEDAKVAFTRAHQLVRQEIEADPEDTWLLGLSAEYLAKGGDVEKATSELEALSKTEGLIADTWYDMAQAYEAVGQRDAALNALSDALRLGYSTVELKHDPEFSQLRRDVRYHRLMILYDERTR